MLKVGIPRDQLYFTSKVPPKEVNYEGAKKCVDESNPHSLKMRFLLPADAPSRSSEDRA